MTLEQSPEDEGESQVIPRDLEQKAFLEEVASVKALKWEYLWQSPHSKNAREVETH